MDWNEFEAAGHRLVDQLAVYLRNASTRPVTPGIDRDTCMAAFAGSLSGGGIGWQGAIDEVEKVLSHSLAMSHPLYLGLVNSSPHPLAALGDLLVSVLDNNSGATHQGPAAAAAEREILSEIGRRLGYPADGLLLPGGSYANLHAVVMARHVHLPEWVQHHAGAVSSLPRLYVADGSHLSIVRAATTAGFGHDSIAVVDSAGRGEMDVGALIQCIEADRKAGHRPFAVMATAGSTGTGALDPLEAIADVCQDQKLWFHVDACYGGAAALLDRYAPLVRGMERADSLAFDLHKWLFMPLTVGLLLTRHADVARTAFRVHATYIPDDDYVEAYQRGIPTSRRSSSLAVWFAIRAGGWGHLLEAIERNIQLTREIERRLAAAGFRVLPGGELSIACARWEPASLEPDHWDGLQRAIASHVCASGKAWFATTQHHGQTWLRLNMVNLHTREEHIEPLIRQVMASAAHETEAAGRRQAAMHRS